MKDCMGAALLFGYLSGGSTKLHLHIYPGSEPQEKLSQQLFFPPSPSWEGRRRFANKEKTTTEEHLAHRGSIATKPFPA